MVEGVSVITGSAPGPSVAIMAGVHGDERAGIRALTDLLQSKPKLDRGRLYLLFGNPRAIRKNVRFTEDNLNRQFARKSGSSYEYTRAQELKKILNRCDVLLDLHATSISRSKSFIIAERNSNALTKQLPIQMVCHGFDTVEPGGTDYYMNKRGKIGICVETGHLNSEASYKKAKACISSLLRATGLRKGIKRTYAQEHLVAHTLYKSKTHSFVLRKSFSNFAKLKRGDIIGRDGDTTVKARRFSRIIFAHHQSGVGKDCFILLS